MGSEMCIRDRNSLIANYSTQDSEGGSIVVDAESKNIGLAVQHTLSKRTNVYIAFNKEEIDRVGMATNENDNIALGVMHSF